VEIVLTKRASGTTTRWSTVDGVLTAAENGEHVTITVTSTESDALLTAALGQGWSVRSVAPHQGDGR
jgi:hypothetical protein